MKRLLLFGAIFSLLILNCTKKTTTNNNYYSTGGGGAIVGIVSPAESNAKVTVYMGIEIASTTIDTIGYFKLSGLSAGNYSLLVQAQGYNDYTYPYINVTEGTTALHDTVFLTSIHDLIRSVMPSDGAEGVGLSQSIVINFRRKMDNESAEKAFTLVPPMEGKFSWYEYPNYGQFELIFTPADNWAASTLYEMIIDTTASDTAGIKPSEPYRISFTTELIRITSTSPRDKEALVSPSTYIYVYFNTSMDAESVNSAFKMVDSELKDVTGRFTWYDPQAMYFFPDPSLGDNETYTVTIDTTAKDNKGARLSVAYQFSFTTESTNIDYTDPHDDETWVAPKTSIWIQFNTDMDRESLISAFQMVDSELNEVKGEFSWNSLRYLTFRPNNALTVNETFSVTIDTTASNTKGSKLSEPYQFSFTTQPLTIVATRPANRETWVSQGDRVSIAFNTDMDAESVISAFEMVDSHSEHVTGEFTWSDLTTVSFRPDLILTSNEIYTVTIDTTAKDTNGTSLENAYTFWFKTRSE